VQDWRSRFDSEVLLEMTAGAASEARVAWRTASARFVAQARTASMVFEQNTRKSFAPPSRMVRNRLQNARGEAAGVFPATAAEQQGLAAMPPVVRPEAARQRARRWRVRWRAPQSRVRARECLSQQEITTKAPRRVQKNVGARQIFVWLPDPKSVPEKGPKLGARSKSFTT